MDAGTDYEDAVDVALGRERAPGFAAAVTSSMGDVVRG
jgi:hypothetical protein